MSESSIKNEDIDLDINILDELSTNNQSDINLNAIDSFDSSSELNDITSPVKKLWFKESLNKATSSIKDKLDNFIEQKWRTEQKELWFFEIRDNFILIVLLAISLILWGIVSLKAPEFTKAYEVKVKTLTSLQKEVLTFQKKTQWNERYKDFSDLLQFWVKVGDNYYPAWWYLTEFIKLYPTKESLNFWTFTEGWTSDFITWRGEKVRKPKDILKEYRVASETDIDDNYKKITYTLKLEWSDSDINEYLSLLSWLKLVSNLSEIKEKKITPEITSTDVTISFYLKK